MKKLTITRDEFLKTAAGVCSSSEHIKAAIKEEPFLFLAFGVYSVELCAALFGEREDGAEAEDDGEAT